MPGRLNLEYSKRAQIAQNPAAAALFRIMAEKETNLAFSNDETDPSRFFELADKVGPEIAVLKTHIDTMNGFSQDVLAQISSLSQKHNFLVLEDRKFADIGNTVVMQYSGGVYRIADWANMVTVHAVPGPGIIDAIGKVMEGKSDGLPRGALLLAQMSSQGNLATSAYTDKAIEFASKAPQVISGYIGNGSDPSSLMKLSSASLPGHAILTPGVQMGSKGDSLGQRYSSPQDAVRAGSDCVIVGRGIYKANDPKEAAHMYREAAWGAYLERVR